MKLNIHSNVKKNKNLQKNDNKTVVTYGARYACPSKALDITPNFWWDCLLLRL